MNNRKNYSVPQFETISFLNEDIIMTSGEEQQPEMLVKIGVQVGTVTGDQIFN